MGMVAKKQLYDEKSSGGDNLLALIYMLSKFSNDRIGRQLGDRDWTVRQVQLLEAIDQNQGCSQLLLSKDTGIDTSTVSEMMRRLAYRHLIVRRRSKIDARAYTIWITPRGRQVLKDSKIVLSALEKNLLRSLSGDQRSQFISLLRLVASESRLRSDAGAEGEAGTSARSHAGAR